MGRRSLLFVWVLAACSSGPAAENTEDNASARRPLPAATAPKAMLPEGFYPRAIRLPNGKIVASVVAPQTSGRLGMTFFESINEGYSFDVVGHLDDARNAGGICCGTLYRLTQPLGTFATGTLLYSASLGGETKNKPMSIVVWSSSDDGRSWSFLSTVTVGSVIRSKGGLWEPEFTQLDSGTLVVHWSDETDGIHSQRLVEASTTNGIQWTNQRDTVSLDNRELRPGMPVIRRLPDKTYVMSYEICNAPDNCGARWRTSRDGWNWGDPRSEGVKPLTLDGASFRHAPTITEDGGRLFLVGQLVFGSNNQIAAASSGSLIFANTESGKGYWYPIKAPVPVPDAFNNWCPNYSSPLLTVDDGKSILELASKWDGDKCRPYFARAPLGTGNDEGIGDGRTYSITSLTGYCLDLQDGSTEPGADIRQWPCNGAQAQAFTPRRADDGSYAIQNGQSGQCLTVVGDTRADGADVRQQPCNGSAEQKWGMSHVGVDHYAITRPGTSFCLDVAGGSLAAGANVQQWTCNGRVAQTWKFGAR